MKRRGGEFSWPLGQLEGTPETLKNRFTFSPYLPYNLSARGAQRGGMHVRSPASCHPGGSALKKRLDALRKKDKRFIVGIETGNSPGKLGAVLVEVSGSGDETVLSLRGFTSRPMNPELQAAFQALERDEKFDSEELAGINFLVLHHLSKLYEEVLENAEASPESVDCIGLSCLEVRGLAFPGDPAVFSEMTNRPVASRFRIGMHDGKGRFLDVEEPLLQGIVSEMIDRFGLDEEVREAVTVALLTNESIFNEGLSACVEKGPEARVKGRKSIRATVSVKLPSIGGKPCLCGEFFFPR
jgi:hypothetical protein